MQQILLALDAPTMVLMSVILYVSLACVLAYTYFYRKTYKGFGFFTLGQLSWSLGIFLIFYRVFGREPSLILGNSLLFLQGVLWYRGIALYGGTGRVGRGSAVQGGMAFVAASLISYYTISDFSTCHRVLVFSVYFAIVYGSIALEPFLRRGWRTYSMQSIFSTILFIVAVSYGIRGYNTVFASDCGGIGGADPIVRMLLLASMFLFSLLTFCLLSMTSGRVESELREARDALRKQAQTDFLTDLPNRRHFLEQADKILEESAERGALVSLVMLDLDHFKDINDTYGHQTGDVVLQAVGRRLVELLRDTDRIGRLGGEEFGILLPGLGEKEAVEVAHRLRKAVADLRPGGHAVTASLGVASGVMPLSTLLARADVCLYAAKGAGRNRVVCQDCLEEACMEATA